METSDGSSTEGRPSWYRPGSGPSSGPLARRAEPGNMDAVTVGAHSPRIVDPLALAYRDAMVDAVPGLSAPAFRMAVTARAKVEAQVHLYEKALERKAEAGDGGVLDLDDPKVGALVAALDRLRSTAMRMDDRLGLNPQALALLGGRLSEMRRGARAMGADLDAGRSS